MIEQGIRETNLQKGRRSFSAGAVEFKPVFTD
jgi:hypothetical protein